MCTISYLSNLFNNYSFYLLSRFILIYSVVLCTAYNSALTTTIVGCLKVIRSKVNGYRNILGHYLFGFNMINGLIDTGRSQQTAELQLDKIKHYIQRLYRELEVLIKMIFVNFRKT